MQKTSAGLLMYRVNERGIEVFLVHPGGPFWARKDLGAWSIPKGEPGPDEAPLEAAIREFDEETGIKPSGAFVELTPIRQKAGKTVLAWAFEGDADPKSIRSNSFRVEWPPKSGTWKEFPEVDRAAWFPIEEARARINQGQSHFLSQLERLLGR
ncbi:MAG: NUDIX domain-containing protein [Acidobacteria bacterium]|nr:MAG: NUDIX domain-containing protein [Acidobacteriota bacterium]